MKVVGTVTKAHLAEMERRGMSPKAAVDQTLAEAKKRHPDKSVIFSKRADGSFDLVAL